MAEHRQIKKSEDPIYKMLMNYQQAIKSVLPQHLKPERMLRVAHTMIYRMPKLKECTPVSLINAVIDISMKGLEIGSTAHIIPFKREATVIYDYKGFIELAHRSGQINSFPFKPVYQHDVFEVMEGTERYIKHIPAKVDRGSLVAAYAIANFKHGGFDFEVVYPADIEAVKNVAPGAKSADSPWNKADQEWTMWCKTAVRRLAKRIPQSPELQSAVVMEERVEAGLKQDLGHIVDDAIEADFQTVETETKESAPDPKAAVNEKLRQMKNNGQVSREPFTGHRQAVNGPPPGVGMAGQKKEEAAEEDELWYHTDNWMNLKTTGFTAFILDNQDKLSEIPDTAMCVYKRNSYRVIDAFHKKWSDINPDNAFPGDPPPESEGQNEEQAGSSNGNIEAEIRGTARANRQMYREIYDDVLREHGFPDAIATLHPDALQIVNDDIAMKIEKEKSLVDGLTS